MDKMIYAILSVKNNQEKLNLILVGMNGIAGANLNMVSLDGISAVVSDIRRGELIADKSNALAYAGVIENLAQQFTLLPMRYNSLMESTDSIIKILKRNLNEIQLNLRKVENKCEFGLKIFCNSEKLRAEMKAKSVANTKTPAKPAIENKYSVYRDYLNKKLIEHRSEELLLTHVDKIIQDITTHLAQLNPIHKFKKMTTATNIIDVVFLLEKDKKEDLIHIVKDLQNQYTGLRLMLTGPWPPYNFVDITLK